MLSCVAVGVSLLPLVYLGVRGTETGWGSILTIVLTERVAAFTIRSLALAAVVGAASLVIGVASAVLVTRTDLPGRRHFAVLAALPLAVPSYVAAYSWLALGSLWPTPVRLEGFGTAAVVLTLCTYPYVYLPVAAALTGVDRSQEEVARSLGRTPVATLFSLTLRQVRPAILGGGLLAVLYVLSDFGAVAILRVDTFTRAIFTAFNVGFDRGTAVGLSSILVLVTVVILVAEGRTRAASERVARVGSGVRRPHVAVPLGAARPFATAAFAGVLILALGLPLLAMIRWFGEGISRPGSIAAVLTAMGGSLAVAATGTMLTMALAIPLGLLVARVPGRFSALLNRTVYIAHALPGVVVGLSLVFFGVTFAYPLYQTTWMLALAYAVLFLPLGVGAVAGAAAHAPPVLEDVARSLGHGPWRTFRRVTAPLTLPGVGMGAALVLLTIMKELPATLMLRPTGLETMATRLWSHTEVGSYAAAAPYAVLLVLLAAVPTWALVAGSGVIGVRDGASPRGQGRSKGAQAWSP
ncbi:ABC transporter permease [Ruania alkalisoli]|uniref:ABC transporter permease n=1 Tax=Ruania alkalisoli TaxID=2779775 RepID=UPI001FEA8182|nr:iron ABC transporter permease [Ruania alkalisoli]